MGRKRNPRYAGKASESVTVIAKGTRMQGDITTRGPLHLDGTVDGNVDTADTVMVGANGNLSGILRARQARVGGRVEGEIICERLEIEDGGRVYGEVLSRSLVIAPGGTFLGSSREMDSTPAALHHSADASRADQMNDFHVVTGLPPGRMHLEDELVRKIKGDHNIQRPGKNGGQENISIRVESVQVVPQPLGTYWAEVLDQRGQMRTDTKMFNGKIGVIDVGFRTSDFATIVDGEYAPAWSRTVPLGISTGYDGIANALATEFGLERETYTLDDAVIDGKVNVSGRETDISELRDRILGEVATKLFVEAQSLWQVAEYDHILVTGGGGHVLYRYLSPHVPQAELVSDPVTANARGYLAWALHLQQGTQPQEQPAPERHEAFSGTGVETGGNGAGNITPDTDPKTPMGPSPYEPTH